MTAGRWQARCGAAALLLSAGAAAAGEPAERDRLPELLRGGADAAKAKKWDACIAAYSAAVKLEDSAEAAGELGLCEEAAARFPDAHRHLSRALQSAVSPLTERQKRYQAAFANATDHVGFLFVTVRPTDARIVIDGRPWAAADGRGIAVEPGTHKIVGKRDGYEDKVETRTVSVHDMNNVHLLLLPKVTVAPIQIASRPAPIPPPSSRWYVPGPSPRGVFVGLAYASAATTLAAGGAALGLELDRVSMAKGFTPVTCDPSNPQRPPPSLCEAVHERRLQRDMAVDATIGAAIGTGVFAAVARFAHHLERRGSSVAIAPAASAHGGGLMLLGAW